MLKAGNVSIKLDNTDVFQLKSINIDMDKDNIAIIGPNGSGKTVLVKTLLGMIRLYSGKLEYNNIPLSKIWNTPGISTNLPEVYKILRLNINETIRLYSKIMNFSYNNAMELINEFDLKKIMAKKMYELSTGEQKMVGNIIAMSSNAKILLLDEPFDNIDQFRRIILAKKINESKSTILLNTHEIDMVKKLNGYDLYLMLDGKLYGKYRAKDINDLYINKGVEDHAIDVIETKLGKFSITKGSGNVKLINVRNLDNIFDEVTS
jgi:ABC-type multidrug transport system ATPase subunit